jgi:dipeptidyl aminopeptidase/acylaminoacyl peptidase
MKVRNVSIASGRVNPVNCCIKVSDAAKKPPLVIFAHGFKGFMNWGGFPYFTTRICEAGYNVVSVDFSMNGVSSETPEEFSRLDLFAENTISHELNDLEIVIDHFCKTGEKFGINNDRICLIGHSRGGGTAILKASEDSRIRALVTLAAVSSFDRYSMQQKNKWRKTGYIEIPNTRTNQMMRMNVSYLDDIEKNSKRLNIKEAAGKLDIPYLIVHGKEDLAVKCTEALELYDFSKKQLTELVIIENTGHTFGIEHPFKGTTTSFEEVIERTVNFLDKNL